MFVIMNRKQLEPKERELIAKVLDFRFEIGTKILCLKDVFAKITLKLDAIPPVYKDNFDIEELKPPGCRAKTTGRIVALLAPVAPDFHPKNHRRCNRCK